MTVTVQQLLSEQRVGEVELTLTGAVILAGKVRADFPRDVHAPALRVEAYEEDGFGYEAIVATQYGTRYEVTRDGDEVKVKAVCSAEGCAWDRHGDVHELRTCSRHAATGGFPLDDVLRELKRAASRLRVAIEEIEAARQSR